MSFPDKEPVITASAIVALVAALLSLAIAFRAPITDEQRTAIIGLVTVVAPIAVALLARPYVTPNKIVDEVVMDRLSHNAGQPHG